MTGEHQAEMDFSPGQGGLISGKFDMRQQEKAVRRQKQFPYAVLQIHAEFKEKDRKECKEYANGSKSFPEQRRL